jgi:hypothetical protein
MNGWVEAPPPKPMGCLGKGCLILAAFMLFLGLACVAGMYWGFRNYSVIIHSAYWLSKANAISETQAAIPPHETTDEKIQLALERWNNFKTAARSGQTAEIELTATEINDLIASDPETRGKLFVSIDQNHLRLQTSVPMGEFFRMSHYYANADVMIKSDGEQSFVSPRLSSITVNNEHLPSDLFDWKYRARRLRDYLSEKEEPWNRTTFEIRDGKVILRSRAQ